MFLGKHESKLDSKKRCYLPYKELTGKNVIVTKCKDRLVIMEEEKWMEKFIVTDTNKNDNDLKKIYMNSKLLRVDKQKRLNLGEFMNENEEVVITGFYEIIEIRRAEDFYNTFGKEE